MISLLLSAWALQEAELQAGVEAYRAGDHARAAGHFEASIQRKESAEAWANLGHARAVLRENAAARKAYDRALELGPQDRARVSLALGRICLLENDPRAAVDAFAGALDGAETAADAWRGMARARELLKDRSGAIDAYRQAAARHPKDDALQARLAHLLLEARRGEEALDVLRSLIERSPEKADWRLLAAQAALQAGELDEAEIRLEEARFLGAERPSVYRALGDLLLAKGRGREAAAHYGRYLASEEKPGAEDRMRMGLALLQAGELASAEAALRKAAAESDTCRRGLLTLARTLAEKRGTSPALAVLDAVPSESVSAAAAGLLRAELHLREGRDAESLKALDDAWARGERSRDFLATYVSALAKAKRTADLKSLRIEALALYPEDPRFRN